MCLYLIARKGAIRTSAELIIASLHAIALVRTVGRRLQPRTLRNILPIL